MQQRSGTEAFLDEVVLEVKMKRHFQFLVARIMAALGVETSRSVRFEHLSLNNAHV